jgi:hypothetical protein
MSKVIATTPIGGSSWTPDWIGPSNCSVNMRAGSGVSRSMRSGLSTTLPTRPDSSNATWSTETGPRLGRGRFPLAGLGVTLQPEPDHPLLVEEQDLGDVALLAEDPVHPLDVTRTGHVDLTRLPILAAADQRARLGQPRQQPDAGVAAGQMLIEIAEVGAQVLQEGMAVEQIDTLEHQRQVDHHDQDQRGQAKQEKKQKDTDAQGHAGNISAWRDGIESPA